MVVWHDIPIAWGAYVIPCPPPATFSAAPELRRWPHPPRVHALLWSHPNDRSQPGMDPLQGQTRQRRGTCVSLQSVGMYGRRPRQTFTSYRARRRAIGSMSQTFSVYPLALVPMLLCKAGFPEITKLGKYKLWMFAYITLAKVRSPASVWYYLAR